MFSQNLCRKDKRLLSQIYLTLQMNLRFEVSKNVMAVNSLIFLTYSRSNLTPVYHENIPEYRQLLYSKQGYQIHFKAEYKEPTSAKIPNNEQENAPV